MKEANDLPYKAKLNFSQDLVSTLGRGNCPLVQNSADLAVFLNDIAQFEREVLMAAALDTKNRLLHWSIIAIGTSNFVSIRTADVFRGAILTNATSVVLGHNHPTGSLEPSGEDFKLTQNIAEAGLILGYQLLDHVIVSSLGYHSLMSKASLDRYKRKSKYLIASFGSVADGSNYSISWMCPNCSSDNSFETMLSRQYCVPTHSMPTRCESCKKFVWLTQR